MTHLPENSEFGSHLARLGEALDRFLTTERADPFTVADEWRGVLDGDLPEAGIGAEGAVGELLSTVLPNGARIADPGFWGFITTGPSTVPTVATAAAAIAGTQRYTLTAFNHLEELSLEWLAALCGLGPHMKGVYSSGGSTANLVALGAARQWAYEQRGIDPAKDGMGEDRAVMYASTEAHHTVQRSAAVLGIGRRGVRAIPIDDRQRMRPDALRQAVADDIAAGLFPVGVVATAGTTNTGAIDPLRAIGEIAAEHGMWFHVDGAYGLPGILDDRVAERFDGLEMADSAIVDPHKWLAAPVGVGATFVRDRSILHRAFTQEPAEYLEGSFAGEDDIAVSFDSMGIPYGDFGVELSAPSRGVVVWSIIREQGREGITARVRRDNDFARRVHALVDAHPRLENLIDPELSIACFRHTGGDGDLDDHNRSILRRLVRETPLLPSATEVGGRFAIRPCFINPRTTHDLVDALVDTVARIGDELTGG